MVKPIGIIILAAGFSERMGTPKPLLRLGDKTFLEHILTNPFVNQNPIPPLVVVGYEQERIRLLIPPQVKIVENPDYFTGRMSSINRGINSLHPEVDGALIWPVDFPIIPSEVLSALAEAFVGTTRICIPSFQNRRGHPPLIGAAYFSEILQLSEPESLRTLYSRHPQAIVHVPVDTDWVLQNINTPEDYESVLLRYRQKGSECL